MEMPSKIGIKVVKMPIVRTQERDFEYAYQSRIIYYVRLSNGIVVNKPEDFPNNIEEDKKSFSSEKERMEQDVVEENP